MTTAQRSDRGWWRRLRASTAHVPPFDPAQLRHWNRIDGLERDRRSKDKRANLRQQSFRRMAGLS